MLAYDGDTQQHPTARVTTCDSQWRSNHEKMGDDMNAPTAGMHLPSCTGRSLPHTDTAFTSTQALPHVRVTTQTTPHNPLEHNNAGRVLPTEVAPSCQTVRLQAVLYAVLCPSHSHFRLLQSGQHDCTTAVLCLTQSPMRTLYTRTTCQVALLQVTSAN